MKALMKVARGKGNVQLKEVPAPVPAKGQVLIRVHVAAVCGTDVHIYYDRFSNSPPFVLGHEFSGVIEGVGGDVESLRIGDRVVSANNPFACGTCAICLRGYPNLCSHKKAMGIHSDGCFAEYVLLPACLIHHIPDNVSFEDAALMEPLAVAVHSVWHRCGIEPGDFVVVFGPGAIGLLAAQVARAEGARDVLIVGTNRDEGIRFECAKKLGIDTVNIEKDNLRERVMDLTGGGGPDVVVEASGSSSAIVSGMDLLRKNGRMAISGITGRPDVAIPWDQLVSKAVSLFFAYSSLNLDWQKALGFVSANKVKTSVLITHRFGIEQWKDAFEMLERLEAIRPIFVMQAAGDTPVDGLKETA